MSVNENCGICGEVMKDQGYKAYGCELCPVWLHAKCIFPNASEPKLKVLFEFNSSFDVKCRQCQQNKKIKLANLVTKDDFKKFTSSVEKNLKSGFKITEECAQTIQENQIRKLQNTFAEALKGSNSLIDNIESKLEKLPDIALQISDKNEEVEKNKRKNNLILFKLPESIEAEPDAQLKEDCSTLKQIIQERVSINSTDIVNVFRLGQRQDSKVRPLLVKFKDEAKKWEVLRCAKNLRLFKNNVSYPLFMTTDKTPKEQQVQKDLLKELRERKMNGEENLVIKNSSIIKKLNSANKPFPGSAQKFWADLFN